MKTIKNNPMQILMKRVYEPASENDGYRVLVDRLWPQGESKEKAELDFWGKEIAPSNALRTRYHHEGESYPDFVRDYDAELKTNPDAPDFLNHVKGHKVVTLLSAVKDLEHSHVPVIKQYIEKNLE